jgi:hypothetical protein
MTSSLADGIAQGGAHRHGGAAAGARGVSKDATQLTTEDAPAEAVASHILPSQGGAAEQVAKCEEIKQALQGTGQSCCKCGSKVDRETVGVAFTLTKSILSEIYIIQLNTIHCHPLSPI